MASDDINGLASPDHSDVLADLLFDDASIKMLWHAQGHRLVGGCLRCHLVERAGPMRMKDHLSHTCTLTEGCYRVLWAVGETGL
jgi:hypothetical protein